MYSICLRLSVKRTKGCRKNDSPLLYLKMYQLLGHIHTRLEVTYDIGVVSNATNGMYLSISSF